MTRSDWNTWAAGRESARITDWLRESSEPDWSATVNHVLFDALAEGRMSGEHFADYMVQDYGFVDPFTALLGHAIGQAPTMDDRVVLGQFMGMLTSNENTTFQRTFETFNVTTAQHESPHYLPATRAFRDLLQDVGQSGHYAEILAVLVVTERVYLQWASRVNCAEGLHPLMEEWVYLHNNPDFEEFVAWLQRRLDEEAAALGDEPFARMAACFRDTVAKERAFHDAVWAQQ